MLSVLRPRVKNSLATALCMSCVAYMLVIATMNYKWYTVNIREYSIIIE